MRRGLVVLLGFLCMGVFSGQALAQTRTVDPGPTVKYGYIEICKQSAPAPLAVTGPFSFTITDSAKNPYPVTVSVGLCSQPIKVVAGAATIVEAPDTWYSVVSIAGVPGSTYLTDSDLASGTAYVDVPESTDFSGTATVTYTNKLDPGVLEICKAAATGSGLTGSYSFTITGNDGFSATATAQVGSCSPAITVPAGNVTVQEAPPVYISDIEATSQGVNMYQGGNLYAGTAIVKVNAGDVSNQTSVTFTDNVTTLKLCKAWSDDSAPVTGFPFSFGVSGPAGPNGPTAPISLTAGTVSSPNCVIVGQYRAGTLVAIAEGVVPGTKVSAITLNGGGSIVPDSLSLTNRTVTVSMAGDAAGGETVVTYTDDPALPGLLKICKAAGTPPPTGASFVFTIGTKSVTVPVGQCVIVGPYPFNSTQTIVETLAGDIVQAIGVAPTYVTEIVGGVPTLTSQTALAGAPNLATGTVQVVIGENTTTEVTYTDTDPPVVVVPPASGGSSGGSSSSPSTPAPAVTPPVVTPPVVTPPVVTPPVVTPPVVTPPVVTPPAVTPPVVTPPVVTPPVVTPPATPVSVPPVATPTVVKAKLAFASLATTKLGKVLQVRVTGPNATAKIKITLLGKNGKVLKVVTKTVPTNKLVRVAGLTISKATVAARVTVVQ